MSFYGDDFALVVKSDGSLDFDVSRTVTGPIVVLQRIILKILAFPGQIWWEPTIGTNLRSMRGTNISNTDIAHFQTIVKENIDSDPQVSQSRVKTSFAGGKLNLYVWIQVGVVSFQQSIVFDGQNVLSGGGSL